MAVRSAVLLLAALLCATCALRPSQDVQKLALLAPFEGRYSEIGYDALYAVRLAVQESGVQAVELLAVDDGGSVEHAVQRALALVQDPAVQAVLLLGPHAVQPQVQQALGPLPALIVGHWDTEPSGQQVYTLASEQLAAQEGLLLFDDVAAAAAHPGPFTGGDLLLLQQFPLLRAAAELEGLVVLTPFATPDAAFIRRYRAMGEFAGEPWLFATLSYDAARLMLHAIEQGLPLAQVDYHGLNGRFRFEGRYRASAPIHRYYYTSNGQLVPETGTSSGRLPAPHKTAAAAALALCCN